MAQYIDKSPLVAEIESKIKKLRSNLEICKTENDRKTISLYIGCYNGILSILNNLEVKEVQEEPVSEDLEEAAITAADEDMQGRQIMEESNENRQLYSRIFRRGFKAGAQWRKKQMMAKAFDAEVLENYDGKVIKYNETILDEKLSDCKVFDKVKVIVIKEE